jgi:hypothetical protein
LELNRLEKLPRTASVIKNMKHQGSDILTNQRTTAPGHDGMPAIFTKNMFLFVIEECGVFGTSSRCIYCF